MDGDDEERIFIFIRLRYRDVVLARTKIRELAGLGTLLADFLRAAVEEGISVPTGLPLADGAQPVMEYVDANSGETLIGFRLDAARGEQVVEGRIPPRYRRRMLDPQSTQYPTGSFVERAAPDMTDEEKEALAARLAGSRFDLIARIREAMDDDGRFEVHLPVTR